MKQLINMITFSRLLLAPVLILLPPLSRESLLIYGYCGVSDVLDGWLARRFKAASQTGARLDSLADLVFFAVSLWLWLPRAIYFPWMLWWLAMIMGIKLAAMAVAYYKFRQLVPALHTLMNKGSGLLLFFMPAINYLPPSEWFRSCGHFDSL